MKVVNLKIYKKLLLFLISGTISFNLAGCSKNESTKVVFDNGVETPDNNSKDLSVNNDINTKTDNNIQDNLSVNNDVNDQTDDDIEEKNLDKYIYEYLDNTYGFVKEDVSLREESNKKSKKIANIEKYEKIELISKSEGWDFVKYNGKNGYIKDKKIKKILQEFIDIDISEQKLRYYDSNGKVIVKSDIVTGLPKENSETRKGWFKIFDKNTNRYLVGPGYKSYVSYFMPFDGDIGMHDADGWRSQYGGDIYKTDGSHGCVNMPYKKVQKVFNKSKIGTRVLVHK